LEGALCVRSSKSTRLKILESTSPQQGKIFKAPHKISFFLPITTNTFVQKALNVLFLPLQGAAVGGASVVTSVTFAYKSANCSAFAGNSTSLTIDGATLRARQQNTYVFREPRLWTTGKQKGYR